MKQQGSDNFAAPTKLRHYVGDAWHEATSTHIAIVDPSFEQLLAFQARADDAILEQALSAAHACHQSGELLLLGAKRADLLHKMADKLAPLTEELAALEATNTGVVLRQTRRLATLVPMIFRAAANALLSNPDMVKLAPQVELWHKARGPAIALAPWNAPLPIGMHKLASAMAAGAPVILKPSERTPLSTQRVFAALSELDLPRGAIQLLHGGPREAQLLVRDRRSKTVSFTGGYQGGMAVAEAAVPLMKPVQLELGGHNPLIILPDADLEQAIDGLITGLTTLNGQWCRAVGQVFVPEAMARDLLDLFAAKLKDLCIGPSMHEASAMGPLAFAEHKQHLTAKMQNLRAKGAVAYSLNEPDLGNYLAPTLLGNVPLEEDFEELFGPVAIVHTYTSEHALMAALRQSRYGLAAYIYGHDPERCVSLARQLEVGSIKINQVSLTALCADAPRSAWGISGLRDEGNLETMRFFQGSSVLGRA